jgi:hypothetical protein
MKPLQSSIILLALMGGLSGTYAQGTAFTYQGRLNDSGGPAGGRYDLRFALYDAASAGGQQGNLLTNTATVVSNGLFTVTLDFGNQFSGAGRWLEIAVRTNGAGAFTPVAPRQWLTPTPYAVRAASASVADTATVVNAANLVGTLPASQVSGVIARSQLPAGVLVVTNNPGNSYLNLAGSLSGGLGGFTNLDITSSAFGPRNHLRFNDTPGNEQVWFHAAKNMDVETVNDGTLWVGRDFAATIDHDTTLHGKHDLTLNVDNNLSETAGFNLNTSVANNFGLMVGSDLSVTAHNLTAQANLNATLTVGAYLSASVGNSLTLDVGNNLSITAGSAMNVSVGTSLALMATGGVGIGSTTPQGMLEIQGGADSFGNSDARSLALAYRYGGYRHWIRTRHNSAAATGNAIDFFVNTGNTPSASAAPGLNNVLGLTVEAGNGGSVGIGTASPQANLHVYSANNPTVVRVQSSGTPGFGRLEFLSNPQGDANEWRPAYIQSTDAGNFTGGLAFVVNGTGVASKFGASEVMRIQNGRVGIGTTAPVSALQVVGTVTATAFNPPSDRNLKENFTPVSPREVLEKVAMLSISRWNFIGDAATLHVGPMAQDFHAAFGLGTDERHIATVDADGVALAAIQGLNEKLKQKETEIAELKHRLDVLEKNLSSQKSN